MKVRGKWLVAVGIAAAVGGAGLGAAGPASAVVGGVQLVVADSPNDSVASKSVEALCPAGKKVVGGGGSVVPAPGSVVLTKLQPIQDAKGGRYAVAAQEGQAGFAGNWKIRAWVMCAAAPAGLHIVSATGPVNSQPNKTVAAACPAQQVLGAGAAVNGGQGQVHIQAENVLDTATPPSNQAKGLEDGDGFNGNWSVTAFAVCVDPVPGYTVVRTNGPINSAALRVATAFCPSGTRLHGAAAVAISDNGNVVMSEAAPDSALISVRGLGQEAGAGTNDNWTIQAEAICAR